MASDVRRILMTGGAGFVGRHLAAALARRFPEAACTTTVRAASPPLAGWDQVTVDLADAPAIDLVCSRIQPDLVVHLAAQSSVAQAAQDAGDTWRSNALGSYALAAAVARHAPRATVLFVSSAEVYGATFNAGPATEDSPLLPLNPYSRSKAAAEQMFADILPRSAPLIVARPFNHTGPGQSEGFVLPSFAAQIARIEAGRVPPRLSTGNLDAERDFLDVLDVVEAYVRLLTAPPPTDRLVVNIASGRPLRIGDALARLEALATASFDVVQDPGRLRRSDVPRAVGDAARLASLTGWSPRYPLDAMLQRLLDHWRAAYRTA